MIVALILYASARGTRSSRAIERACAEDIAYRVIAAQSEPDHATLARFVERHRDALAGVFGEVLALCARAGLAGLNVVAVDGSKVAANAAAGPTSTTNAWRAKRSNRRARSMPKRTRAR